MTEMTSFMTAILASFLGTLLFVLALRPVSLKIQLVDIPGGRKQHRQATPLIGGIAMLLGFSLALLLLPESLKPFRGLIFGSILLVFVGVLDDFHEISPRGRLITQTLALCVMIFASQIRLENLGNLIGHGTVHLHWFAVPVTLFGAASLINAINMIDGQDGLSGSVVLISMTSLASIAFLSGYPAQGMVLVLFMAALLAYLCFNFPLPWRSQASIFMGDAGSMLMGFVLAWFTISLSQADQTWAGPVMMLWVVAIPLLDLGAVFIKRLRSHRSPFEAGPDHLYNVLQTWGLSKIASTLVIITLAILTNIAAWIMIFAKVPEVWALLGFLVVFAVYCLIFNKQNYSQHQRD